MISAPLIRSTPRTVPATRQACALATDRTVVMKFGGSSVGSGPALKRVGSILTDSRSNGAATVGVLSAMFGVTNKLLESIAAAELGDATSLATHRESIWALHERAAQDLLPGANARSEALDNLHALLDAHFDSATSAVLEAGEASTYNMDVISSVGERLSNELLASHLRFAGWESEALQADTLVVTDGVSGNSMPLLPETTVRVQEVLKPMLASANSVPLVTGFFGASAEGKLTTLGRGGSDLTAATLGYCLDADEISLFKVEYTTEENGSGWLKDWEGGFVGVVHDADVTQTIPELDYEDARELAHFGKKVLHPETVSPAVSKGIPIHVRCTADPSLPSTLIHHKKQSSESGAVVSALTKISVDDYVAKHQVELPAVADENVIVALVGQDLCAQRSHLEEACTAVLNANGIPSAVPETVNGSAHNFSVVVPAASYKDAVRLLHDEFVDESVTDVVSRLQAAAATTTDEVAASA